MKIQIVNTPLQIYRGYVREWVGGFSGCWQVLRKATARDRKRIITVR